MEYKSWTRKFWTALAPDAGTSMLRYDMFESGNNILEMAGTVGGRGVLLRWLNDERGVVTVRSQPYDSPEEHLDGEQTHVTASDDPGVFAARARQLVLTLATQSRSESAGAALQPAG
jgi:hypothetical protein